MSLRPSFRPLPLLFLALAVLAGQTARAQSPTAADARLAATLDSIAAAAYPADEPGAAVIVVRDGQVLHRGAYGMADLELGVPMRPEMVFRIGSITKQFTGTAILMLAEEGKLSLSDSLTRFLPDYPTGGRYVSVEQLLAHTSGIRSYTGMDTWASTWRNDLSLDELIAFFRDEPFDFEPGTEYRYNNSGYLLLGAIIEQVSGMPYEEFLRTRIFQPLGMSATEYDDAHHIIPNRARGYSRGSEWWHNAEFISMSHPHAAGALVSTVDDLARWDAAIARGELLSPDGRERAFTPVALSDGRSTGYGAGWMMGRLGAYATAEHGGGIHGFVTYALRAPEAGLFVAVLANADAPVTDPEVVAVELADTVLGISSEREEIALSADQLAEYVGVYRIDPSATRTITREGEQLYSQRSGGTRFEIYPIGEDRFAFRGSRSVLAFEREVGRVVAMRLHPRIGPGDRAVLTDEPLPATSPAVDVREEVLAAYVGRYRVEQGFEVAITMDGGALFAQATGQPRLALRAESDERFAFEEVDAAIEFQSDDGAVTRLVIFQAGQEIPAERID